MKARRIALVVPSLFFLFNLQTHAIPAFARKYGISCITCHAPSAPKLKAFGDQFAGDGFRMEEYQAPRYYQETGDQKLSLLREFPLAVRMDGYFQAVADETGKTDLSAPYLIKLLSGGSISDHFSYYFYFYMSEHGEVAGVEDAFLMYNNLFNTDLDVYFGQFQVSDPLFKRELRLTFEDYSLYTARVGISDISMKYDHGLMLTYGLPTATDVIFMVVNGNGLAEATFNNLFDKDKYKSFLGRVSQGIGKNLRVGIVGYYGKEEQENFIRQGITNETIFFGPDATVTLSDILEFNMQYLLRKDGEVYPESTELNSIKDIHTNGVLGEVVYSPGGDESNWYAVGLYNYVESSYEPADYHSATLHLGYLVRRNIRFGAEFTQIFTDPRAQVSRFSLNFVSGF